MNRPDLLVCFGTEIVGRLRPDTLGRMRFAYDAAWLQSSTAFAVSVSLPLREEEYATSNAHTFFANLLPEGTVRQAVCRRLGLSEDNDFELLRAIGGDCAGALSLLNAPPPEPLDFEYEELSDRRLQALISNDRIVPLLVGGTTTRLSLAGAQDKVPVALLDGRIHLPIASAPSTHILKLPSKRFKHIAANEAFVVGFASKVGLDVVHTELLHQTRPPSLLVERYDRRHTETPWPAIRIHQEDLCQALGLPPARKYEQEGGPTLAAAIELVRGHVNQPLLDASRLIAWQAFNLAAGNSDGHGKNLSLLRADGSLHLAPFYDLLSTRAYPSLDRSMAMSVGGRRDPDAIDRAQWTELAVEVQLDTSHVLATVRDVGERCEATLSDWTREFREKHGPCPLLQTLPAQIARRARRLARSTKA